MDVTEKLITDAVLDIVRLREPDAREIGLDQELVADLGLGSLDLAELGATLEVKLGMALFDDVAMNGFVTVRELVEFCTEACRAREAR